MATAEASITINTDVIPELRDEAKNFIAEARWTMPRIFTGHPVAHEDPNAKIKNFSTITKIVETHNGQKYFLIYRYPLSPVHSLTDNIQRWISGRPSSKPFKLQTWDERFYRKSRIGILGLNIPGLMVMKYIPNWNLWDLLHENKLGNKISPEVVPHLYMVSRQINHMHSCGVYWGELIVNNILLRKASCDPVICDTEVDYWPWIDTVTKKAHDWRDFIFSACGAFNSPNPEAKKHLAEDLFSYIADRDTKVKLVAMCRKRRHLGQVICWQGMGGALSCSWSDYTLIRRTIVKAWETTL